MTTRVNQRSPIPASAYKVAVFAFITALLTGLLATLIGNISLTSSRTFYALFTDAASVFPGDHVRISGVEVGSVRGVELVDASAGRKVAKVEFTVKDAVPVFSDAQLQLRYENIVGQRYLSVQESPNGGEPMSAGGTFPLEQTTPALNLTQLFNGFQPLFRTLNPEQLNKFSFELVQALQGESGSVQSLFRDTAELTNTLADKDAAIARIIDNLGALLTTIGNRDIKLSSLIVEFRDLMVGLANDRDLISQSLPAMAQLLNSSSTMVRQVRPPLRSDIQALETLTGQVYSTRTDLQEMLDRLPRKLRALDRAGSYGSWFNFYTCGLEVRLRLRDGTVNLGGVGASDNDRDTVCAGGMG